MLSVASAVKLIKQNKEFSIKYVAHGDKKAKRAGGYIVDIPRARLKSSYHYGYSLNIEVLPSGNIRECKAILILEVNGIQVYY